MKEINHPAEITYYIAYNPNGIPTVYGVTSPLHKTTIPANIENLDQFTDFELFKTALLNHGITCDLNEDGSTIFP